MKALLALISLAIFPQVAFAGEDLAVEWERMITSARTEAKIVVTGTHTGVHGGVSIHTLSDPPKFLDGRKGDAALAYYNATAKKFADWAKKNGASKRSSNVNNGELSTSLKARNGDSFSILYQPSNTKGADGSVTFIFVDASEFLKKK